MTLNSQALRQLEPEVAADIIGRVKRLPVYIVLEDVLDTYNIGGFFRLADAIAAEKIYICGQSAIPPDSKIRKASIGTYQIVPWEYRENAAELVWELRREGIKTIAIEQSDRSRPYLEADYDLPCAFVLGNETTGLKPETLSACDQAVEIPMRGINKSLNVMVAAGVIIYQALAQNGL